MKPVYIIFVALFIYCASSLTLVAQSFSPDELNDFEQTIDTMSLANLRESIHQQREAFEHLLKLDQLFLKGDTIRTYLPEEEETEDFFTLDTSFVIQQFNDALTTPLSFVQDLEEDHTELKFQAKYDKEIQFDGVGYFVKFIPTAIYYSSGKVQTDSIPFHSIDYHFGVDWGLPRPIDSITFRATLKYVDQMDSIEVNVNQKEANYQGGQMKIVKADRNFIYYTISDTIPHFKTEVLNAAGAPLKVNNSTSGPIDPAIQNKLSKQLSDGLTRLDEQLKDNSMTVDAARKKVKRALASIDLSEYNQSKVWHYYKWGRGNVHAVRLFTNKHETTLQCSITAVNKSRNRIVCLYSKERDSMTLMNVNGEKLTTTIPALSQINSNYYEGVKYYYYFNEETLAMDTIRSYYLFSLNDSLICRMEDDNGPYVLYNRYNKIVGKSPADGTYDDVTLKGDVYVGSKGKSVYVIHGNGSATLIKGATDCSLFNNGYAAIENEEGLRGYVDKQGKVIIPCIYYYANDASENTFCVRLNNKDYAKRNYGFLDIHGKTIIPFMYSDARSFLHGVALVKLEGKGYGLINKNNEAVVPLQYKDYNTKEINDQQYYILDNDIYDSYGKFIKTQE